MQPYAVYAVCGNYQLVYFLKHLSVSPEVSLYFAFQMLF